MVENNLNIGLKVMIRLITMVTEYLVGTSTSKLLVACVVAEIFQVKISPVLLLFCFRLSYA